jgi:hypothetical protein
MYKLTALLIALCISFTGFSQIVFEDGFETGNTNEVPPTGWFCGDDPEWMAGEGEQSHNRSAHNGSWYSYFPFNSNSWMYHEVELIANQTYEFSMWIKTDGAEGFQYEVKWGDDTFGVAMTNTILPLTAVNNTEYEQLIATFSPTTSGTFYIGIHGISTNNPWYLCIDDVKVETVEDYNFELTRVNSDTIVNAGSSYDYYVTIKNTGLNTDTYSLSSNSEWDVEFYDNTGVNQITMLSLDSYEIDTFIVRQFVPNDGVVLGQIETTTVSVSSESVSLVQSLDFNTTAVSPIQNFPYQQGFENIAMLPVGWNTEIVSGNFAYEMVSEGSTPDCSPHDGSNGMAFYRSFSASAGSSALLSSPPVSISDTEYIVRFWLYRTADIDNKADKIEVYKSDDPSLISSTLLGTIHRATNFEPVETTEGWFEYSYVFSSNESIQYIVFKAISAYGWNMYIDDVTIKENLPDVMAPEFLSINETVQYADLDMPLTVVIRDESQVTETMQGIYNVGNGDESFIMHLSENAKGDFTYTGNIPAQANNTSGTVRFMMEDILGNSDESDEFPIEWSGIAPLLEESFEDDFPPAGWEVQGEQYTWFYWQQAGTEDYEDSDGNTFIVVPPHGEKQAMVGWDFQENAQDEWLISPEIEITDLADLSFENFTQYGSNFYDHYTVGVSTDGINWDVLWDAFYLNTMVNQYDEKVTLPLDDYLGQTIRVAWRAYNDLYDPFWYSWFIDDVRIEKRSGTGISKNNDSHEFDYVIHPNPVSNTLILNVQSSKVKQYQIKIYNSKGQLMKNGNLSTNTMGLQNIPYDVSTYTPGVYVCHVNDGISTIVKKFVVVR